MHPRAAKQDFVFVSKEGKQTSAVKKILKPAKMAALRKAIQTAFGTNSTILTIKKENGQPISDIRDVTTGMKLLVVFENDTASVTSSASRTSARSTSSRFSSRSAASSQKKVPEPTPAPAPLSIKNAQPIEEPEVTEVPVPEEEEEELDSEPTPTVIPPEIEEEEEDEYEYVEEEEEEQEETDFGKKLVETVISCDGLESDIEKAFEMMINDDQTIMSKLLKLEDAQKARYAKEVLAVLQENFMYKPRQELMDIDIMIQKARDFVREHRFSRSEPTSHVFKAAVMGPKRSGKSTFLGILTEELLMSLIATDAWKHTFVFAADMDKFASTFDDLHSFYCAYVRHTFQLFRAQAPTMLQYLTQIETAFTEIVDFVKRPESVNLPRRMVQDHSLKSVTDELQRIGMSVVESWFDASALRQWLTSVFLLPITISRAFGFTEVVFVLDNFDAVSRTIDPIYPFDDAPDIAFVHEHLRFAMSHCSFIVSGRDCGVMGDLLVGTEDSVTDLSPDIDYLSVLETSSNLKGADYDLWIEFADNRAQLKMDGSFCGGVPLYVAKWNALQELFDRLDEAPEDSYEREELTLDVVASTQKLLAAIMDDEKVEGSGKIEVASVKRYQKRGKK